METAVAEKLAATNEEAFNFASYMKERAQLVNEALDKSVPLQYPEIINESMRQAYTAFATGSKGNASSPRFPLRELLESRSQSLSQANMLLVSKHMCIAAESVPCI